MIVVQCLPELKKKEGKDLVLGKIKRIRVNFYITVTQGNLSKNE